MLGFERTLGDPCFRPLHRADGSRDGEYQQEDCCRDPFHNSEVAPYNRYRLLNWCYAGKILKVTYVEPRSGASRKVLTSGCPSKIDLTISRCTPIPRPWMIRTSRKPRWSACERDF